MEWACMRRCIGKYFYINMSCNHHCRAAAVCGIYYSKYVVWFAAGPEQQGRVPAPFHPFPPPRTHSLSPVDTPRYPSNLFSVFYSGPSWHPASWIPTLLSLCSHTSIKSHFLVSCFERSPTLPFTSCVISGKSLHLSGLYTHLQGNEMLGLINF